MDERLHCGVSHESVILQCDGSRDGMSVVCSDGETGRHEGLKIPLPQGSAGSSPARSMGVFPQQKSCGWGCFGRVV